MVACGRVRFTMFHNGGKVHEDQGRYLLRSCYGVDQLTGMPEARVSASSLNLKNASTSIADDNKENAGMHADATIPLAGGLDGILMSYDSA